jgi:hypothetical protein
VLIRPRPTPPNPLLYSVNEYAKIQLSYLIALDEWQRETTFVMWANAIPIICASAAGIALALMGPSIVLDMIRVLAQ